MAFFMLLRITNPVPMRGGSDFHVCLEHHDTLRLYPLCTNADSNYVFLLCFWVVEE